MSVIEGHLTSAGRRFGIVAARTNDLVVSRLLDGALDAFRRTGAADVRRGPDAGGLGAPPRRCATSAAPAASTPSSPWAP